MSVADVRDAAISISVGVKVLHSEVEMIQGKNTRHGKGHIMAILLRFQPAIQYAKHAVCQLAENRGKTSSGVFMNADVLRYPMPACACALHGLAKISNT